MEENKRDRDDKKLDFETGMKRLQELVEKLERQDIPLEEAVNLFEEGMELSRKCAKILEAAEERVKVLMRDQETGKVIERDLDGKEDQDFNP